MKVIIAGSRSITSQSVVIEAIRNSKFHITEIVSGCARGVDRIGEEIAARQMGVSVKKYPANWNKYGKSAGYIRNQEMAKYADALIAVWDGKSKGTKHMIDIAKKEGLRVYISFS